MEIEIASNMKESKSKRITMNINGRLPTHIISVIFSKLPIVNLPVCRLVCQAWNDLVLNQASTCKIIPSTFFLGMFDIPEIHSIDFDPKHLGGMSFVASIEFRGGWSDTIIRNSCNGLLFIYKLEDVAYCAGILNPMTNEYIRLPGGNNSYEDDETYYGRTESIYKYGFGFSPRTKLYKVVRVTLDINASFEIFTFGGSNQWRCVDFVPFKICDEGVYFNGALYWIGIDKRNGYEYVVCRLDVENEKVETTIYLSEVGPSRQVSIQAFNGSLYATFFYMYPCYKIEVWRMLSYGREDSWIREFVINNVPGNWVLRGRMTVFFELIKVYEDGEILCRVNTTSFILYNPKIERIKTLTNPFEKHIKFSSVCQVNSFNFGSLQKILAGDDR